jgi:hypothetical protein
MLDHEPAAGCEVYSSTAIVPTGVSNTKLIKARFDKESRGAKVRYKFIDAEILS